MAKCSSFKLTKMNVKKIHCESGIFCGALSPACIQNAEINHIMLIQSSHIILLHTSHLSAQVSSL